MAFKLPAMPKLSLFGKKSCLSVDVGTAAVKICRVSGGGDKYKVDLSDSLPMPPGLSGKDYEAKATELLTTLIAKHKLSHQPAIFALPAQAVVIRYLTFQGIPKERLEGVVRHEAEGHIPFPLNEVSLDWCEARKQENGFDVLLVAIKRDKLDSMVAIIEDAGLELQTVDVTTLALFSLYYHSALKDEQEEEISEVFVDIGAGTTDIAFLKNHRVFFTRSVPIAGRSFTEIIAKRLSIPEDRAEQMKIKHAEVKAVVADIGGPEGAAKPAGGLGLASPKSPGAGLPTSKAPGLAGPGLAGPKSPGPAAPAAGGLTPPKSPGLAAPAAGGLTPPKSPGLTPPAAGGLTPPKSPGLAPPAAGGLAPPAPGGLKPPGPPGPPGVSAPAAPTAPAAPAAPAPIASKPAEPQSIATGPSAPPAPPAEKDIPKTETEVPLPQPPILKSPAPPAAAPIGISLPKPPAPAAPAAPAMPPAPAPPATPVLPKPPAISLPKPPGTAAPADKPPAPVAAVPPAAPPAPPASPASPAPAAPAPPSLPKPPSAPTGISLPKPPSLGAPKPPAPPAPPMPAAPSALPSTPPAPPTLGVPKPPSPPAPPGLGIPKPPALSLPKPPAPPAPPSPPGPPAPPKAPDGKSLGAAKAEDGEVFSLFESDENVDKEKLSAAIKPIADRLATELRRSFDYFAGQLGGGEIKRVTLSGGGAALKGLPEYLSTQLNVKVSLFDPMKKLQASDELSKNIQPFSAAIGMGMRVLDGTPLDIDMLPENIIAIRRMRSMGRDLKYFAVAAVLMLALFGAYAFLTVNNTKTLHAKIQADIQELESVVSRTRQLEKDQKTVNDMEKSIAALVAARANWIAVLSTLDKTIPDYASLTSMVIPIKDKMEIKIVTSSLNEIPEIGRRFQSPEVTKGVFNLTNRPSPREAQTTTGSKVFEVDFSLQVNHAAAAKQPASAESAAGG